MTQSEALAVVQAHLQPQQAAFSADGDELVVDTSATIERPWGWVFFYTSRRWRETGEARYAIAGNAPLLVERRSGRLHVTGTSRPIQDYLASFERYGDPRGGAGEG